MSIEDFEGFVSTVEIGDKVYYHNNITNETVECTVDYTYIHYKVGCNMPWCGVIEIFLKNEQNGEVIKLTDAEADTFELFHGAAVEMFNDAENYLY